ncbi:MAG: GIY-YIG nuclease family protein [Anaerolineales bacterium]|jgi:putative endonuclease
MAFYCYILQCADGTFYTGWTTNLKRRVSQHNRGRGAYYTRSRRPVHLVYAEELPNRSSAMRREQGIKRLSHLQKQRLIENEKCT